MIPEAQYLAFARALVKHFADRVVGLDPASERLIRIRPSDQVLGGFVTPRGVRAEADDDGPLDDLPQDSSYEQTSLGVEWRASSTALEGTSCRVHIALSVYARVMPTFEEQERHLSWRTQGPAHGAPPPEAMASIIPVWHRVDLEPIDVSIVLTDLPKTRKHVEPLTAEIQARWQRMLVNIPGLYPAASPIDIPRSQFTKERFSAWCAQRVKSNKQYDWSAELDLRYTPVPDKAGCGRISLRIVNRTPPRDARASDFFDANLYAVSLRVTIPSTVHENGTFHDLEHSYRYDLTLPAVGLNCHAVVERDGTELHIQTDAVPRKEVGRLEPRALPRAAPTFARLIEAPVPLLRSILQAMRDYDRRDWAAKIAALAGEQRSEAEQDRQRFRKDEIDAFERGITLLEDPQYSNVIRAFRLMNEAMQAVATNAYLAPALQAQRRAYVEWRLFQIIFVVCQIPILAAREYPELHRDGDDRVEILWFAAGGGKTEAFVALIVWQAFFDRLRGKRFGTAAFVRFPLRLLAFQQLQRVARALAAADLIRAREKLGGARFSLGYYVGGTQTPNSIDNARHQRYQRSGVEHSERKISECPYCGFEVSPRYDSGLRMIEHRCTSKACPGGNERLPIYIVDRDIERFLPTAVISTVDKLAQFGQQQRFTNLLGRTSLMCSRHGASFRDTETACEGAAALGPGPTDRSHLDRCGDHLLLYPPFHDLTPALLIQDELHLLSEELGTFDSHYETAIIQAMETLGHAPWKIIAATATISRFEEHAQQIYLRSARQFPAPGPEATESFYYSVDGDRVGRIFVGVLGVGRKHTPAVTKALSLLYQELQGARDLANEDIQAAGAKYGVTPASRESFHQILFYYELILTYVLTRKGSDQVAEAIESRVKRDLAEAAPHAGDLRIDTFNGSVDMSEMIDAMRAIENADSALDPSERTRGLVTTNIIGHGVDVDRFNIMVFAGFTRLVAEYIQASARVGRRFPGISVLVATPQAERDRSILERFSKFHEYLDRLVDASSVNRWPLPALRRTVPGLLAGYLMGVAASLMNRRLETVGRIQDAVGTNGSEPLQDAAIVSWMQDALGCDNRPGYAEEVALVTRRLYSSIINSEPSSSYLENLLNMRLRPMRSLRDVDDPADVTIEERSGVAVMKVFRNG